VYKQFANEFAADGVAIVIAIAPKDANLALEIARALLPLLFHPKSSPCRQVNRHHRTESQCRRMGSALKMDEPV
jgi:hypothetical protein